MKKTVSEHPLSFEIAFFERLLKEYPDFVDALLPLADAYTKAGELKKGLEIDKRLAKLRKTDDTVFYNLACSYALLGLYDEAFTALRKAVRLGYCDIRHMQFDQDLAPLREDPRFAALMKKMHQKPSHA